MKVFGPQRKVAYIDPDSPSAGEGVMIGRQVELLQTAAIIASLATAVQAAPPILDKAVEEVIEMARGQQILALTVRVVDQDERPIARAKLSPWALQSSQGHGGWKKEDKESKVSPEDVMSDADGLATLRYPKYRSLQERIGTIGVSIAADHPEFAYDSDIHIDVPLEGDDPYVVRLKRGVPLEVRPTRDGAADLENVFALWSDDRSWKPGVALEQLPGGMLRIPAMPPDDNSLLLVKLDGERATHFSKLTEFKLVSGGTERFDVPLRPSIRITGALSENVPRPIRAGRVRAWTLNPNRGSHHRVSWFTWVPIQGDGTFAIDGWPDGEALQLIALCEGYMAASGIAPDCVKDPPDAANDPFSRPQVFEGVEGKQIELLMMPLVECTVSTVDEDEKPVAGVSVMSWPNVCWWNGGSQIYCDPLTRGERILRTRDYLSAIDRNFAAPFTAETDGSGTVTLHLPPGREALAVDSDVYELPVFLGRRDVQVQLARGETSQQVLRLQPRGTEKLGEWDKLAGVVFGCSTREGRRICALPGVRKQMDEFQRRFREARNQRDPQLLSEAYAAVADAFVGAGDTTEAAKWRQKSDEQAAKAKADKPQVK
jgi:hypothetical protein